VARATADDAPGAGGFGPRLMRVSARRLPARGLRHHDSIGSLSSWVENYTFNCNNFDVNN
jgi:hypothetical protein